jgi:hypothetical protein
MTQEIVYFAKRSDGYIKIGVTRRFNARMNALRPEYGNLLHLGVMPGNRELEQSIHKRFADLREQGTEFFAPAGCLLEFIDLNTSMDIPSGHEDIKHIAVQPETKKLLHDFVRGCDLSYDATLRLLLNKVIKPDETPIDAGQRVMREEMKPA